MGRRAGAEEPRRIRKERRLDCARDSAERAIHSTRSEARWAVGSNECNLVSCAKNRVRLPWPGTRHARHCATLMAGLQQGRTKRPLTIGGPCRAQNLRSADQVRAPSSDKAPSLAPSSCLGLCSLRCIALQCTARAGRATFKGLSVSQPDGRHDTVLPGRPGNDGPSVDDLLAPVLPSLFCV